MLDTSGRSQVEEKACTAQGCGLLRHSFFRCAQSGCPSDSPKELVITLQQYELETLVFIKGGGKGLNIFCLSHQNKASNLKQLSCRALLSQQDGLLSLTAC